MSEEIKKPLPPYTKPPYKPHTPFGIAVEESGFNRVCPRCYKKWSSKSEWMLDTTICGSTKIKVETPILPVEYIIEDGKETKKTHMVDVELPVRAHHRCGGEMIQDKSIESQIQEKNKKVKKPEVE